MNSKQLLLDDLGRYQNSWGQDRNEEFQRYWDFVETTDDCCERSHQAGHCTGSAFVVSPNLDRVLLLFHPFLQRWLQPGGHADGSFDLLDVARREANEESGLPFTELRPYKLGNQERTPFDLDIHPIPDRPEKGEPAHFHYDLRFLLVADPKLELTAESPEMLLQWLKIDEVSTKTDEESVLRMVRKVQNLS